MQSINLCREDGIDYEENAWTIECSSLDIYLHSIYYQSNKRRTSDVSNAGFGESSLGDEVCRAVIEY